jgi:Family of unknown function (DUF5329)
VGFNGELLGMLGLRAAALQPRSRMASAHTMTSISSELMRRLLLSLLTWWFVSASAAAPLPPAARTEIDGLMNRLEASGCEFERNGSWHTAAEARAHLLRKLKYLEERGAVKSAEQFIELAASASSLSGEPYRVRCASGVPVASRAWMLSQLQALRSAPAATKAP